MNAIADASSLIILARQDALWLLERTFDAVALVPEVEIETVIQGKARGYGDARRIEAAIAARRLAVLSPSPTEQQVATAIHQNASGLSRADCLTLACAKERDLTLIMEEQRGRNVAVAYGVNYVIIQVLPLQGLIARQLSFAECDDLLLRIGRAMRTDQSVLTVLRTAAEEIQRLRSTQEGSAR